MAKKLNEIIVVDIESTCWDHKIPGESQESEIIEIGVCVVNVQELTTGSNEGILVLPKLSTVSKFCTDMTTITQEMLDKNGIPFDEACSLLYKKYKTSDKLWASWGDYDRRQFERQCKKTCYNARYPFGPTHLNVKNLFAIKMGLTREVGMDEALKLMSMELQGTHHRGIDDAQNIARIACKLLILSLPEFGQAV